ncbi:DUF397 domain-containing protein [Actinomadura rubrisoli]|uniref:DUF397 domain-containing protein n=1 Tax=Actinomadura rubrisoli TaxID=2530368 RepID=A0A4R5C899_9ACTN|nr:DUF397 domain-containing protein [Actinomadura rubrisoli]TDD94350.1 DUF397 domain-containing protein [Actinomadura rubrisoli]
MDLNTATWRKSSHSAGTGGECVEMASVPGLVAVRDSKDPNGPKLIVTRSSFAALVAELKR